MKKIDFHFNVSDRLQYACKVAQTVLKKDLSLAIWSSNTERLHELDRLLWTHQSLSFHPHLFANDPDAKSAPILLSTDLSELHGDVLLLLDDHLPDNWEKSLAPFDRIIDVVSLDEEEKALSRARFRAYKSAGVELATYDRKTS